MIENGRNARHNFLKSELKYLNSFFCPTDNPKSKEILFTALENYKNQEWFSLLRIST